MANKIKSANEKTTIVLSKKLKKQFDNLKIYPNETSEQMIKRAVSGELYPNGKTGEKDYD
jgi:hypothetical protein